MIGRRAQLAGAAAVVLAALAVVLLVSPGPRATTVPARGAAGSGSHPVTPTISGSPSPAPPVSPVRPVTPAPGRPASHQIYWGAGIKTAEGEAPWNMNVTDRFSALTGKRLSVISWGSLFYSRPYCSGFCPFTTTQFQVVRRYGAIPMISWGPEWKPNIDRLVADGAYDAYLTQWARAAKAWGHPFFLRFAWEANGSWFPWSVGRTGMSTVGNTPATYVAMWRHVYNVFHRVGADNVTWVWCPNVNAPQTYKPLRNLYPGGAYVDWTCLDGYNGDNPYYSFRGLFGPSYRQVTRRIAPHKPMIIGEVSSTEAGGSKATWISNMFRSLPAKFPDIYGFVWYEVRSPGPGGHSDWPLDSTASSTGAFRSGVASRTYAANAYSALNTSPIPAPRAGDP